MQSRLLQLVSVGVIPPSMVKDLEEPLLSQMAVTAVAAKKGLQTPTYAFNKDRGQYHTNAIMRRMVPLLEPGSCALGIAEVDLFVPDSPFVFGDADRESRVAVLSLFRLRQNGDVAALRRRVQVEALHQAGHLVGLSYCEDARCVMFLATTVQELDRKGIALCNLCRNELAKLNR